MTFLSPPGHSVPRFLALLALQVFVPGEVKPAGAFPAPSASCQQLAALIFAFIRVSKGGVKFIARPTRLSGADSTLRFITCCSQI